MFECGIRFGAVGWPPDLTAAPAWALGGGDTPPEIHRMAILAVHPERHGATPS
jgi:hypothetical protein